MTLFVVTYSHPDAEGWQKHVAAHVAYLRELLAQGVLRASGPVEGGPHRAALLIIAADNIDALEAIVDRDPFALHGLIDDMEVRQWDPIFGAFNGDSSMPSGGDSG